MNTKIYFNIAAINRCTTAEGPYKRLAIWFQGCNLDCPNCCNLTLQKFEKNNLLTLNEVLKEILYAKQYLDIEGITLTGGEPTLQMNNLPALCREINKLDLGIILFTGQQFEKLPDYFLKEIDTIIDGPYNQKLKDTTRKYVGSTNQRVIHLTNRYSDNLFYNQQCKVVNINVCNRIIINGDPITQVHNN